MTIKDSSYTLTQLSKETGIARETWRTFIRSKGKNLIKYKKIKNGQLKPFKLLVPFETLLKEYKEYSKDLRIKRAQKGGIVKNRIYNKKALTNKQ